jgi:hypothetical protein
MKAWATIALVGCAGPSGVAVIDEPDAGTEDPLPGHDDCLPPGEEMSEDVCRAVIAEADRVPNVASDHSGVPAPDPDPRVDSEEYAWLTSEVKRCTCSCCHIGSLDAPGVHRWDLEWQPVWIDSMSDWSMEIFAGLRPSDGPLNQMLPTDDPERLLRLVQEELARRDAARDAQ